MAGRKKYYVVFRGVAPGIYTDWNEVAMQVENFSGALYKGYNTSEEAANAFRDFTGREDGLEIGRLMAGASLMLGRSGEENESKTPSYLSNPEIDADAWAVDASCLGNPGKMEYQGVEVKTGKRIFRVGPFEDATNNIGEFLAIVHAMALMAKEGKWHNIYSDSVSGMAWVRTRKIKTTLKQTERNKKVFELMARAIVWLNTHTYPGRVMKWQTELWGEIPADFGRK